MKIRNPRFPLYEKIIQAAHHYLLDGVVPTKDLIQKSLSVSKDYFNQALLSLRDLGIVSIEHTYVIIPDYLLSVPAEQLVSKAIIVPAIKDYKPYKDYLEQLHLGSKPEKAAKFISAKHKIENTPKELIEYFNRFSSYVEESDSFGSEPVKTASAAVGKKAYFIEPSRIAAITQSSSRDFDFSKLVSLLNELNFNYENGNYYSVAMLTRAIIDHIPPVFSKQNFTEVANNYGSKSFKDAMKFLDQFARKVSDSYLHGHIRKKENTPTELTVDCKSAVDLLLGEVLTIIS